MLVLVILLVVLASIALVWAVWAPRMSLGQSLRRIDAYGFGAAAALTTVQAVGDRPSLARRILQRFSPAGYEESLKQQFIRAGDFTATPEKIVMSRFGLPGGALLVGIFMLIANPSLMSLLLVVALVALAFRIPGVMLKRRIKARAQRVEREMPDFIELLAITVEAGLSFDQATQSTVGRMTGPLREEMGMMLQELRMGVSREDAMHHIMDRVDSRNLKTFSRSLIQGQALGVPLGQILRNLAIDMRVRRRQMAEERVQKAPLKIIMAAFFLIFPALLVVLMGPAGFRVYDVLAK